MQPADSIEALLTNRGWGFDSGDPEYLLTHRQIRILREAVQTEFATLDEMPLYHVTHFFDSSREVPQADKSNLIRWFDENDTQLSDLLELTPEQVQNKLKHIRMVVYTTLFHCRDKTEVQPLNSNRWLNEHPVMQNRTPHERPYFLNFLTPHKDLEAIISDNLNPTMTAPLVSVCRESRLSHHDFWRGKIQSDIDKGRIVYAISTEYIQLKRDRHQENLMFGLGGTQYARVPKKSLQSTVNQLSESLLIFTSKADAIAFSVKGYNALFGTQLPVFSMIHCGPLPKLQLLRAQPNVREGVIAQLVERHSTRLLECAVAKRKNCIVLGAEIFQFTSPLCDMNPHSRTLCPTVFDDAELPELKSKHKLRAAWHKKFMSTLDHDPTIEDLCNWIVGYCSYYLDHHGDQGRTKANRIRKQLECTRFYKGNDIREFLQFRHEDGTSLEALINHRRKGKSDKNTWGWDRILECFVEPQEVINHGLDCQ